MKNKLKLMHLLVEKLASGILAGRMFAKVTAVEGSEKKLNHLGGVGEIEVWASTESVDRQHEIVRAAAFTKSVARMQKASKFPPFLAAHQHVLSNGAVPVLGGVVPGSIEIVPGKGVKCRVAFVSEKVNKEAPAWFEGYRVGALKDVSVGFRSSKIKQAQSIEENLEVLELDWMELSGAAVGANMDADVISVSAKAMDDIADSDDYSPSLKALLTGLREMAELQEKDAAAFTDMPKGLTRELGQWVVGGDEPLDLAEMKAVVAYIAKADHIDDDDDAVDDDDVETKVEFTEDDAAVFAQIAPADAEYDEGTLREVELVSGEKPVKATVGVLTGGDAESITFLTFPKADGWDLASAEAWLAEADLDALLAAATGDGDDDDDDDAGDANSDDADKDKDKDKAMDALLQRLERATANAEAMQEVMQKLTNSAAKVIDKFNKVVGALPATTKSVKSVAPGHDTDEFDSDDTDAVNRMELALEEALKDSPSAGNNGRTSV